MPLDTLFLQLGRKRVQEAAMQARRLENRDHTAGRTDAARRWAARGASAGAASVRSVRTVNHRSDGVVTAAVGLMLLLPGPALAATREAAIRLRRSPP